MTKIIAALITISLLQLSSGTNLRHLSKTNYGVFQQLLQVAQNNDDLPVIDDLANDADSETLAIVNINNFPIQVLDKDENPLPGYGQDTGSSSATDDDFVRDIQSIIAGTAATGNEEMDDMQIYRSIQDSFNRYTSTNSSRNPFNPNGSIISISADAAPGLAERAQSELREIDDPDEFSSLLASDLSSPLISTVDRSEQTAGLFGLEDTDDSVYLRTEDGLYRLTYVEDEKKGGAQDFDEQFKIYAKEVDDLERDLDSAVDDLDSDIEKDKDESDEIQEQEEQGSRFITDDNRDDVDELTDSLYKAIQGFYEDADEYQKEDLDALNDGDETSRDQSRAAMRRFNDLANVDQEEQEGSGSDSDSSGNMRTSNSFYFVQSVEEYVSDGDDGNQLLEPDFDDADDSSQTETETEQEIETRSIYYVSNQQAIIYHQYSKMSEGQPEVNKAKAFSESRQLLFGCSDAISKGDLEALQKILPPDEINSIKEGNGRMLIHLAAAQGHIHILEWLIQNGGDINATDEDGETMLTFACRHQQYDTINWIKDHHPSLLPKSNKKGMTALHIIAELGDVSLAQSFIDLNLDVNTPSENGTPMELAVMWKQTSMLQFLLENGADPNGSRGQFVPPALIIAVGMDYTEAVILLLEKGADANIKYSDGMTPLQMAAEQGQTEFGKLLMSKGAKFDDKVFFSALKNKRNGFVDALMMEVPEAQVQQVGEINQEEAERLRLEGNEAFKAGRLEDAVQLYTRAIEADGTNSVIYSNRAQVYLNLKNFEQAVSDARISRTLSPMNPKAFYREGTALNALGRNWEAVSVLWSGMKLDNAYTELKKLLVQILYNSQQQRIQNGKFTRN